jgi:hypothetical protein
MNIFNRIKLVLSRPTEFFTRLKSESGISTAFIYLAALALFSTIMTTIMSVILQPMNMKFIQSIFGTNFVQTMIPTSTRLFSMIWSFASVLVGVFIVVAILFVWIKIFGGKAGYKKTYQTYIYASTPGLLFNWIPLIGGFAWIYDLVLLIKGTEITHQISRTRAVLIYILPLIIFIILGIILLATAIALFASFGGFEAIQNIQVN